MSNRKNAYTEVYTILEDLNEEEYNKIPPEVIEAIKMNRNVEYEYELDEELELKEQPMLPETKAILFNLFRDYLSTPEQKEKIIRMQKEERQKIEEKKKQEYDSSKIFENKKIIISDEETKNNNENKSLLVIEKENIFKRIFKKLKKIFNFS